MKSTYKLCLPHPKISVVVPSCNRAYYLHGALVSLTQQITQGKFDYDVVVVDNGSTDNTKQVVESFATTAPVPVRYLLETQPGKALQRNTGIRETEGEWLAFIKDDEFADPTWLQQLLKVAIDQQTQVVGGAVHLDLDSVVTENLSPACRDALRESTPYASARPYRSGRTPDTYNLLISRAVVDKVGMFPEDIPDHGSERNLMKKARSVGIVPWHAPLAVVRHRVPAERLQPRFLRRDARIGGVRQADTDFRTRGTAAVLLRGAAHLARAAMHLPAHLRAIRHPPKYGCSESRMIWWHTEGYLRRTLAVLAPSLFPQKRFHERTNVRVGHTVRT